MAELVAGKDSKSDPVLESALSELSSEGLLDEGGDPGTDPASQSDASVSADTSAAPAEDPGDRVSGKATDAAAGEDPADQGATGDDPYAGTEPFTYTVNGEVRTLEGVYRVPGEGLLVPEDRVQSIEQLAERAEVLDRVSRDAESRASELDRLSQWRTTGADGKEQTLTGRDGLEAMHLEIGRLAAVVQVLDKLFDDPQRFQDLVSVNEAGQIVADPRSIRELQLEIRAEQSQRAQDIRSHLQTLGRSSQSSSSPNYQEQAPRLIDWAARSAGVDSKALTKEDRDFLGSQLDRYERTVTEADRKDNPSLRLGAPIIDAKFTALVKQTAQLRTQSSTQAKAAERAGKHNAGMERGRQPAPAPTKPTAPAKAAEQAKPQKADWDTPLKTALSEMNIER